nr:hypothetical protein [Tanacetum cinerariifolium]
GSTATHGYIKAIDDLCLGLFEVDSKRFESNVSLLNSFRSYTISRGSKGFLQGLFRLYAGSKSNANSGLHGFLDGIFVLYSKKSGSFQYLDAKIKEGKGENKDIQEGNGDKAEKKKKKNRSKKLKKKDHEKLLITDSSCKGKERIHQENVRSPKQLVYKRYIDLCLDGGEQSLDGRFDSIFSGSSMVVQGSLEMKQEDEGKDEKLFTSAVCGPHYSVHSSNHLLTRLSVAWGLAITVTASSGCGRLGSYLTAQHAFSLQQQVRFASTVQGSGIASQPNAYGQETYLSQALNTMTLQEPANLNSDMDTAVSSHLNSSTSPLCVFLGPNTTTQHKPLLLPSDLPFFKNFTLLPLCKLGLKSIPFFLLQSIVVPVPVSFPMTEAAVSLLF